MDIPQIKETDPKVFAIVERIKTMLEKGVESETGGKWLFCRYEGMETLRFSLDGYRITMGGIFRNTRTITDIIGIDGEAQEGSRELIKEIFDSTEIHDHIASLIWKLRMTSPIPTKDGVYEFDPVNGGIEFAETTKYNLFCD